MLILFGVIFRFTLLMEAYSAGLKATGGVSAFIVSQWTLGSKDVMGKLNSQAQIGSTLRKNLWPNTHPRYKFCHLFPRFSSSSLSMCSRGSVIQAPPFPEADHDLYRIFTWATFFLPSTVNLLTLVNLGYAPRAVPIGWDWCRPFRSVLGALRPRRTITWAHGMGAAPSHAPLRSAFQPRSYLESQKGYTSCVLSRDHTKTSGTIDLWASKIGSKVYRKCVLNATPTPVPASSWHLECWKSACNQKEINICGTGWLHSTSALTSRSGDTCTPPCSPSTRTALPIAPCGRCRAGTKACGHW